MAPSRGAQDGLAAYAGHTHSGQTQDRIPIGGFCQLWYDGGSLLLISCSLLEVPNYLLNT